MSLAKLTSVSTKTLSLLLERQRFQSLPTANPNSNTMHIPQITKNLTMLRTGILQLEAKEGRTEAIELLRNQFERMRAMLDGAAEIYGLQSELYDSLEIESDEDEDSSTGSSPAHSPSGVPLRPMRDDEPQYTPYTDDPEAGYHPGHALRQQQVLMNEQDDRLDMLSQSINRQHHISLQINDELDVHTGLLEQLDTDLDRTENRLTGARRRLDRFARGARENGSTVTIAALILILLILIIIFKT
ncbi:hypothetical protein BDN72DRAFT_772641 [Pluteus cervinus]|uniref:Uncharacterized protein n=1 Tax=Pluteus cervinus TaxID=181527 RepID=A0ACD3AM54_9AGAR|nr:hypothetical protein BDN72DRAFT_772641 [Pluteus cervinus]